MLLLLTGSLSALAAPNLVLVSLDTTRADALSVYGDPAVPFHDRTPDRPRTPHLDAFANEGVRFANFYSQSPTTLASHSTMFTGRGPHETLVVRNGFPLDPLAITLAERVRHAGYATRAVLGSAALEGRTGIERGFEVWDDKSESLKGLMYQSTAEEVNERVFGLVDARPSDQPLFLFAHYFDAHAPYEPVSPFAERFVPPAYPGPWHRTKVRPKGLSRLLRDGKAQTVDLQAFNGRYLAEVAQLDAQIGELLAGLERRGVLDDALVVITADHGEVLSEIPAYSWSHGSNISDGVTHIPLLMRGYGSMELASHRVVKRMAPMKVLAPSLEALLGLKVTLGDDVADWVRVGPVDDREGWPTSPSLVVFQEATRPRSKEFEDGWNNLRFQRNVRASGARLSAFPIYKVEPKMEEGPVGLFPVLKTLLEEWDAGAPPHQEANMPDHQIRALKALGYLSD